MNHLARKKIVLVIVEGASDDTALGVALNQVFDKVLLTVGFVRNQSEIFVR